MFGRTLRSWIRSWKRAREVSLKRTKLSKCWVEVLESRDNPSPFTPAGTLGALAPSTSVVFDTTKGLYEVDGGSWNGGGKLSQDPGQTTMLFDFSSITL